MKQTRETLGVLLCFLSLLFLFAATVSAQDMQQIKARMVERKPSLDAMKASSAIGEGNDGYVQIRQPGANAKVVNEENADRKAVNAVIAKKEGTSVEQVSKTAAKRLRDFAAPGHWIQKDDGSWVQK
jgi:uncharacterized protein YdbL (DUF1318 family)